MEYDELLGKIAELKIMPEVSMSGKFNTGQDSHIGRVTTIKDNGKFKGCAVKFPGLNYDVWFSAIPGTDKRSRYMSDLEFNELPF